MAVLLISCRENDGEKNGANEIQVKIAGKGSVIHPDSLLSRKIKSVKKPLIVSPGRIQIRSANNNVQHPDKPAVVFAETICRGSLTDEIISHPDTVEIELVPFLSGIPDVDIVKDPTIKDINPENFFSLGKLQGLKNSMIKSIIQDRSGNLWIGTYGSGASRYDGKYFTHFTENEGLSNNYINCIIEDRNGNILFGTDGGGLSIFDGKNFATISEKNGMPNNKVYSMLEDTEGSIWLATRGGGAVRYKNNSLIVYSENEGLADDDILCLFQDSRKQIWFGTNGGGVSKFDGRTFTSFLFKGNPSFNRIQSVFEDDNNNMWFGSGGMGVISYDGNNFLNYTKNEGISDNNINCISGDNDGNIWIGTDAGGITKYDGVSFVHLGFKEGLSNSSVSSILQDLNGDMWIATYGGGVAKYNGILFTFLTTDDGLTNYDVYGICCDRNGNIWFGPGGGGVAKYDGNVVTHYNPKDGLEGATVLDIINDRKGDIWLATNGKGVSRFDGTSFYVFTTEHGLSSNYIYCILEDKDGNYWFGTSGGGVTKYDGKYFTSYTEDNGLCSNVILSIIQDSNGVIWFGSFGGGISRFDGKKFTNYSVKDGLGSNYVYSMIQDDFGKLWFGTNDNGVTCYDGKYFLSLTEKEGLSNNSVLFMHKNQNGNLWFGTRKGLNKLASVKNKWFTNYLNKSIGFSTVNKSLVGQVLFKTYSYDDGFLGIGCSRGSVCEDLDGNLWIGANGKLTIYHPAGDKTETIAPIIQLTGVDLFNEKIPWSNLGEKNDTLVLLGNGVRLKKPDFDSVSSWYGIPANLSLYHDNNFIMFRFLGISISQNQKIAYQYFLDGLDKTWSTLSTRNEATYSNLSHGNYIFRVRAMKGEGLWSKELSYPFVIRPPWWKTWGFRLLIFVVIGSIIVGFYNWRLADLKIQKRLLEESVRKKTTELVAMNEALRSVNDDLIATNRELDMQSEELNTTLKYLKNTQDQLIQSEKMASLGIMSSGIAHEINNPLNFIKGGLMGLEDFLKENPQVSQSVVNPLIIAMNEGVYRVAKIVSSLSHYSHQGDSYFVRSDIHNIIDNCLTIIHSQTKNRIEIRKFYSSDISAIICNEGKLHQAFLNVISNAVHAIEHNGVITVSSRVRDNNLDISIEDNGCGISKDDLSRVFDPFFTTKDPGKGTGLGLSITYNIIKEHNGTIDIKSEEGKGTTVIIRLKVNQS